MLVVSNGMHHTKTALANGMRVITVPMKDTKSLTLLVLFGTGSKYETKKIGGISHFLEHMFFKGTESRPRPGQINQELDNLGAEHNAFTSKEMTGYWVKSASRHFALALDLVSDILIEPLFKEEEIEKERGVIFQEMSMYLDSPRRYVHDLFEEVLYGDQPAGWDIIGTKQTLSTLDRKDILAYRQSQYVGSNAVLALAGNFREQDAIGRINMAFEPLQKGKAKDKLKVRESQKKPVVRIKHKKTDQTHIVVGARSCNMFDEERYATALLATILGGKSSSRLFSEIREKRGLAYTISASVEHFTDSGYLSIYAGVPHAKLRETIKCMVDALRKIAREGVTRSELQHAKDFYRGQFAISLESSDEVASFYGTQELFRRKISLPEEVMKRIELVTEEEVAAVAKNIFQGKNMNAALIGPHSGEMEIATLLDI